MIASLVELLLTILAVPLIWWVWERIRPGFEYGMTPFGPANDVALMLVLALAVIWAVAGVFSPDYGWRFIR